MRKETIVVSWVSFIPSWPLIGTESILRRLHYSGRDAVVVAGTASRPHALTSGQPARSFCLRQAGAATQPSVVRSYRAGIARAAELLRDYAGGPPRRHDFFQGRSRQQPLRSLRRHGEDQRSIGGRQGRGVQPGGRER